MERYAVVDVETTGFSPTADRIVEVACVAVDGDRVVDRWSTLVNPGRSIPERVSEIHGITDAMVAFAPPLAVAMNELRRRCEGRLVGAHSAPFDMSFLRDLNVERALCTMRLARALVPEAPNHKNQTLRRFLRVDEAIGQELGAHRALDDAIVSAHILIACRRRFRARYPEESWECFIERSAIVPNVCRFSALPSAHGKNAGTQRRAQATAAQRGVYLPERRSQTLTTAVRERVAYLADRRDAQRLLALAHDLRV
jgi:DNA polymerase III epsilon subunit-like protein